MQNQVQHMTKLPTMEEMSKRWTHDEREVLFAQADKMNRGDVSAWARSTSHHPYAPNFRTYRAGKVPYEQPKRVKIETRKIRSLTLCEYHEPKAKPHDPKSVILHFGSPEVKRACDIDAVWRIQKDFWKMLGVKNLDVRPKA